MSKDTNPEVARIHADAETERAKINARQAITVALITAISTFLVTAAGYWLASDSKQHSSTPPEAADQHRIAITSVEAIGEEPDGFRLTVWVNNTAYSFPTQKVWGNFGRAWEAAEFPLPNAGKYTVRFRGWTLTDQQIDEFGSEETHEVKRSELQNTVRKLYTCAPLKIDYEIR